jgi:hypothetical protein
MRAVVVGRLAAARVAVLVMTLVLAIGTAACAESDDFEFKPRGLERPCQANGCGG